ncbi:MAG: phosphate signaling complex protein PhoU [Clostridiales bacterium]|nr:phosphate signaling complex protein PhoU [Clostridiales bacterium]
MRTVFDEQLLILGGALAGMGDLVHHSLDDAIRALIEQDADLAQQVTTYDDVINEKEKEIERYCLRLIIMQQPVAHDLRFILAVLKSITDLERIGDHARDIAEYAVLFSDKPYIHKLERIQKMASSTLKMVTRCIDAFVRKDLELARSIIVYDDKVDNLFYSVKKDLLDLKKESKDNGNPAVDLIMLAKYFERIGDHATNIAEWVVFYLTGEHP